MFQWFTLSEAQLDDLRLAAPVDSVLGFTDGHLEITNDGLPEDISGVYLTENAETFFGVRPLFGRMIEPFDAGHPVVVLNYRFWQRRFAGDPHVIGRTLEMDHDSYTIVGVMPRSFAFNDIAGVGDVYLPASLMRAVANGPAPSFLPWIKLRPHVTVAAANAALEPIVFEMAKHHSRVSWLASRAAAHHRALPAENWPHPEASSRRRCAVADHRLRQLLHPSAGPWPHAPA